jgi:hypothetical protein
MPIKQLKSALYSALLSKGKRIVPTTPFNHLQDFFKMIQPIDTGLPLLRIGAAGDGGYLVPDDLDGIDCCFSPGVSTMADFELTLAKRGVKSFLIDYSVQTAPISHPLIEFERKFLGITNDEIFVRLDDWVQTKAPGSDNNILQMDIEGAEYDVLFDVSAETLQKFRILIIEFHHLDNLMLAGDFKLFDLIFKKITKYFDVVHNHPNNCAPPYQYGSFEIPPIMELTFLRKDRVEQRVPVTKFPHPLDHKNVDDMEDFALPKCWHAPH